MSVPRAAATTPGRGPAYWLVASDGGVFPFGRGTYAGALAGRTTNGRITASSVTPDGKGYWLAGADGGVFAFGDAKWKGSVPSGSVQAPIVAMAATPSGKGYWLAGADGGVFAFGDAAFHGTVSRLRLSAPIVAMAATPSGKGYWLAGADGGVFAFGDAPNVGGATTLPLNARVVGLAATPSGRGYWLAGADGAVLSYGDAVFMGGLSGNTLFGPVVGMARTKSGDGYWLATSDGGVFSFGDAEYYGSVGGSHLNSPVSAIASGDGLAVPATPTSPVSSVGYDISWPQCGNEVPAPPYGFGVVGVTAGHLFSTNPCLDDEWRWATAHGSFAGVYLNTNAFTADELQAFLSADGRLCNGNVGCALYEWGRRGALDALRAAANLSAPRWWLDVETGNEWLPDPAANTVILRGVIDTLVGAGKTVGIYSTQSQWDRITGSAVVNLPTWIAGGPDAAPSSWCAGHSFGGGHAWLVQALDGLYDTDVLCPAALPRIGQLFASPAPILVPVYEVTAAGVQSHVAPPPQTYVPHVPRAVPTPTVPTAGPSTATLWASPALGRHPSGGSKWPWVSLAAGTLLFAGLGLLGGTRSCARRP